MQYLLLGSGYTLSILSSLLLKKVSQSQIILTSTNPDKITNFQKLGFLAEKINIEDPKSLIDLFQKYPEINYIIDSVPPTHSLDDSTTGVKNICAAIKDSKIKRIIYLSSTGVFGENSGNWVDEETPANPDNSRGQARLDCENIYRALGKPVTSLRISGIYGPGRGLGTALKRDSYKLITGQDRWSNRIQVEDLAEVILSCLLESKELPAVLCVSDNEPSKISEVVAYYCKNFNFRYPETIPFSEAKKQGMFTLTSNQRVSNDLVKKVLNFSLKYPTYKEGAKTEFYE